jgi:hypothetical protein
MANHTNGPITVGSSVDGTIFPSAVRTETGGAASDGVYTSDAYFNADHRGVRLYINRTVATGTVTVSVQGKDPVSGSWTPVALDATTSALSSAILTTLTIYPGITAAAGSATASTERSAFLPSVWRVKAVVASATTTWSIGAEYLG